MQSLNNELAPDETVTKMGKKLINFPLDGGNVLKLYVEIYLPHFIIIFCTTVYDSFITKCDDILQNVAILLQNEAVITKCDVYCKISWYKPLQDCSFKEHKIILEYKMLLP